MVPKSAMAAASRMADFGTKNLNLNRDRIGRPARIGAGADQAGARVGQDRLHRAGQPRPVRPLLDLVPARGEFVAHRRDRSVPPPPAGRGNTRTARTRRGTSSDATRGASIAFCRSMPKCMTFSSTCSIAWVCTSPPGVPNGITPPASVTSIAGLGVSRGRLPGATPGRMRRIGPALRAAAGRRDAQARHHRHVAAMPSDGVALNALPQRSTTQQYEVSASTFGSSAPLALDRRGWAVERRRHLRRTPGRRAPPRRGARWSPGRADDRSAHRRTPDRRSDIRGRPSPGSGTRRCGADSRRSCAPGRRCRPARPAPAPVAAPVPGTTARR